MARRNDHTREELKEIAILAGQRIITAEGFSQFSARKVAKEMGYTVGTLYNVFGDYDTIVLTINAATLDDMRDYILANIKNNSQTIPIAQGIQKTSEFLLNQSPQNFQMTFDMQLNQTQENSQQNFQHNFQQNFQQEFQKDGQKTSNIQDSVSKNIENNYHSNQSTQTTPSTAFMQCTDAIKNLASSYIRFANENYNRWNALFVFSLSQGTELPDWYAVKMKHLFSLVEAPFISLLNEDAKKAEHTAKVIWASIHGICQLGLTGKLDAVGAEQVQILADDLITCFMRGLNT